MRGPEGGRSLVVITCGLEVAACRCGRPAASLRRSRRCPPNPVSAGQPGKLARSGRDRQRGVPARASAVLPGPQRPAVKSPGRSVKPPAVREIDLDSSERPRCYDLSQLHELVAGTLMWSRSVSYGRMCRWEIWPALFWHAERDIGILDLCRRWLASTFLVPVSSLGFDHVAAREAGQRLLDGGGLAGLARWYIRP